MKKPRTVPGRVQAWFALRWYKSRAFGVVRAKPYSGDHLPDCRRQLHGRYRLGVHHSLQ